MKEVDLFGIYVSPFLRDVALAALLFWPVKLVLDRVDDAFVWHRPLFDVAAFVCVLAAVTFLIAPTLLASVP